jgi:hypothetical protein
MADEFGRASDRAGGAFYVLTGVAMYWFPPAYKGGNNWWGYRTVQSRSSAEQWRRAQKIAARQLVAWGNLQLIFFFVQLMGWLNPLPLLGLVALGFAIFLGSLVLPFVITKIKLGQAKAEQGH